MDEKRDTRRGGLIGPVILIGLGVVFLLNSLGTLSWSVWTVIFRLWPVLLVAAGLDLLLGRRSVWGSLLALVLTVAIVAGVLWLFGAGIMPGRASASEEIRQALDGATRAEVAIDPAVGGLHVDALEDGNDLVSGVIRPISGERVQRDFAVQGETATFSLRSEGSFGTSTPFGGGLSDRWSWDLGLNPGVPLALEVSLGVGESEVDLTGLQVSELDVSVGVGQTTVVLPREGRFQAKVDGAIGQTVIIVPAGMEVRVRVDTGLAGRQLPAGYRRAEDVYTSPGYAGADDRVDLEVSQAIGNVSIREGGDSSIPLRSTRNDGAE
jgi:hypothetical protein